MHDRATVDLVQRLLLEELRIAEVARRARVSRSTVRLWRSSGFVARPPRDGHEHDGQCPLRTDLDGAAYAYLLGQYLGDGHIARMRNGVYRLGIACCDLYPGIQQACADAMRAVVPGNKVGVYPSTGCSYVTMFSNHWPCLLPQHGAGRKHERRIALEPWQCALALGEQPGPFVRGLVHSDGSRFVNRVVRQLKQGPKEYEYIRYMFCNESADIRELFQEGCRRLGVESRPSNRKSISVARRASVLLLEHHVGPKW